MIEWLIAGGVGAAVSALWLRSRQVAAQKSTRERLRFFRWENVDGSFYDSVTVDFESMEMRSTADIIGDSIHEDRVPVRRLADGRWQVFREPNRWAREQAAELVESIEVMDRMIASGDAARDPTLESDRAATMADLQRVLHEPAPPWVDLDHLPWVGALESAYQRFAANA